MTGNYENAVVVRYRRSKETDGIAKIVETLVKEKYGNVIETEAVMGLPRGETAMAIKPKKSGFNQTYDAEAMKSEIQEEISFSNPNATGVSVEIEAFTGPIIRPNKLTRPYTDLHTE